MRLSRTSRVGFAGMGIGIFAFLIRRVGLPMLASNMRMLGWGLPLIIGLGGLSHLVKTWAWRLTFDPAHRTIPFSRMLAVRLSGEAVGTLSFGGPVLGETTRVLMLRSVLPTVSRISSVTLDRGLYSFTGALLMVSGVLLSLPVLRLSRTVQEYDAVMALGLLGFVLLTAAAVRECWPVLSTSLQKLARIGSIKGFLQSKKDSVREIEAVICSFCHDSPGAFWSSFQLNLLAHTSSVLEVYIILRFLGVRPTFLMALFIEALTKIVNVAAAIVPGNVGTFEGGNILILRALTLGTTTGLALGIARRIRSLFWAGVGLAILMIHGLRTKQDSAAVET